MSRYGHMRYNMAKWIGYSPIKAAEHITAPMLIIDAGKEELMDINKNGKRVADILKARGATVKYHVFKDMPHYGVYREKFADAIKMELAWFDQHLKAGKAKE